MGAMEYQGIAYVSRDMQRAIRVDHRTVVVPTCGEQQLRKRTDEAVRLRGRSCVKNAKGEGVIELTGTL